MKKVFLIIVVLLTGVLGNPLFSQTKEKPEAIGLPGDNFNLYGVLDVFQNSKTLEEFEKSINDDTKNINNLDLNSDEKVDYVRVISSKEGSSHTVILQVAVTEKENQDVAVIDVNKNKEGKVRIQIIGDELLYGANYIVEPTNGAVKGTPNPGYTGGDVTVNNAYYYNNDLYNAFSWPIMTYMYSPHYVIWVSPWYWGFYPPYFRPWVPYPYYTYWGFHYHHYGHYHYCRAPRIHYPNHYSKYQSRRKTSGIVSRNDKMGNYKRTYEGRDYKRSAAALPDKTRPTAPTTRPVMPTTRPVTPTTRPVTRPTTPTTRPGASNMGSNRRGLPSARRN